MSRFVTHPQIQQIKAAIEGVIARIEPKGTPKELTVGVVAELFVFPLITIPVAPVAVFSIQPTPPVVSRSPAAPSVAVTAFAMPEVNGNVSVTAVPSIGPAANVPTPESPTVGVSAVIVSVT